MAIDAIPPALILGLGAFLLPLSGRHLRPLLVLGLPLVVLLQVWQLADGSGTVLHLLDYQLVFMRVDALSRLFAIIFALMAFAGGLYALKQERVFELVAAYVSAGSAIGITMAGDLITLFIFWETLALSATVVVLSAGGQRVRRASMRYLLVHLFGGSLLMVGIFLQISAAGTTAFEAMQPDSLGCGLILAAVLVNAAAPPLSAWLPDAYPEASYSGTVFLSAFTTKTAVYVLLRGFPGAEILIFFGCFMMFYGIIYALLENDMRRILAYSIVNQVGFMVTGIGIGSEMALNGAAAHAFTHIIYKALLLMSAGSVLYMTGKRKCTDLGGLFQSMPLTTLCAIVGALSISSFPLTSGFISKSMISQAAADQHLAIAWFLLTAASAGVFLHAGIKFPWFVFFQKDSGMRPSDPPWNMRLAMILFATFCIGLGIWPEYLYALLPFSVDYAPYTVPHVVNMLQLLMFSGLAFFLLLPLMKRTLTITLDVDWFYRWLAPELLGVLMRWGGRIDQSVRGFALWLLGRLVSQAASLHGPQGHFARAASSSRAAAVVVMALGVMLVIYYF
ncbi:MAG TPA: Na(+)/H(+) antiporter subunit D [Alphaproteobacteria bacterium]|jgi:multicomponent Na+:H+ antiporter subunit D|nr:Na(+)/H(+) antiporter subunit D [Alphaproteobacteria bacterium]MDP7428418.1 Na(+)/H(+) antiporter subunit D [Alphaproteobacteria bacterium]HJM48933.1 Na(+)/H(+) antiporter subunit D [Alphaproteobacteria bacterium]